MSYSKYEVCFLVVETIFILLTFGSTRITGKKFPSFFILFFWILKIIQSGVGLLNHSFILNHYWIVPSLDLIGALLISLFAYNILRILDSNRFKYKKYFAFIFISGVLILGFSGIFNHYFFLSAVELASLFYIFIFITTFSTKAYLKIILSILIIGPLIVVFIPFLIPTHNFELEFIISNVASLLSECAFFVSYIYILLDKKSKDLFPNFSVKVLFKNRVNQYKSSLSSSDWIALMAFLTSVISLYLSSHYSRQQLAQTIHHDKLSVKPILEFHTITDIKGEYCGLEIINKGTGPALIDTCIKCFEGHTINSWSELVDKLISEKNSFVEYPHWSELGDMTISPGGNVKLLWCSPKDTLFDLFKLELCLSHLRIYLSYENIYTDKFTVTYSPPFESYMLSKDDDACEWMLKAFMENQQ